MVYTRIKSWVSSQCILLLGFTSKVIFNSTLLTRSTTSGINISLIYPGKVIHSKSEIVSKRPYEHTEQNQQYQI